MPLPQLPPEQICGVHVTGHAPVSSQTLENAQNPVMTQSSEPHEVPLVTRVQPRVSVYAVPMTHTASAHFRGVQLRLSVPVSSQGPLKPEQPPYIPQVSPQSSPSVSRAQVTTSARFSAVHVPERQA